MQKYDSFEKYLWDKHYNEIFAAINIFIKRNYGSLGLYGRIDPDDLKLDDYRIRSVVFHQAAGDRIRFNATVCAEIIIRGQRRRDYESSGVEKWFSVQLTGSMKDGLSSISIGGVDTYSREKYNKEDALTRYMVPYLYAKDLDEEAEKFQTVEDLVEYVDENK